ncbi:MAG: branched-chain amino acid ABC transporter permease [Alphaproteobacteria bacterium]|nr:branched-chain amino acid ABC transporter permease [Alphaproteobacteria bacterium]
MTRWLLPAAVLAVLIALPHGLKSYGIYLLSLWAVYAMAAMGLNLTLGYAGQVSLAQAAFLGIGAYVSALLTVNGVSFWLALPLAGLVCFAVGILLGFPALRVQHHYLAFVTLGFNALVFLVLRNEEWLTGGTYGVEGIPRPSLLGLPTQSPIGFYYLSLGFLVVLSFALYALLRSPWGRAFAALRENPTRAESLGVDIRAYTLLAFAIGSGVGGLAGAFYAPLVEFIDPTPFDLGTSLALLLMVVVGGSGYFAGPFLGAALVMLLPEWLRFSESLYLLLYALLVMVLMATCPSGLLGLWAQARERLSRRRPPPPVLETRT